MSPFVNSSDVAFSTMFSDVPSVDITRSLYPNLLAALAFSLSFLTFNTSPLSSVVTVIVSFSSGGETLPSMIL